MIKNGFKLGIGSFAYRYAIGCRDFIPEKPMNTLDFLDEAARLGYQGVQLCENLNYVNLSEQELFQIRERAKRLGLFIELGMKGISMENCQKHLSIARVLSSKFLRIVLGDHQSLREDDDLQLRSIKALKALLPYLEEAEMSVGIENHFDLCTKELVEIVKEVNHSRVGLIFDTTNGLGFMERPEETFHLIQPYLLSMHLKDFVIKKVEAGYFITGTTLGRGQLATAELVNRALRNKPNLSIILEMTIRRDENKSQEEVLLWEKQSIEASTRFLKQSLRQSF